MFFIAGDARKFSQRKQSRTEESQANGGFGSHFVLKLVIEIWPMEMKAPNTSPTLLLN